MSFPGQPDPSQQQTPPGMPPAKEKRQVSVGQILGGLLLVLVVVFIAENTAKVDIRLIIPKVRAPLYVAILIAAVLGALIMALLRYRRHRKQP